MSFFTTLPGLIITVGGILVVVALYLLGLFKQGKNKEDDRLINILQGTVEALEKKVNTQSEQITKQSQDIEYLTKTVDELKKMEKKYIEILQGRDQETKEFYKRVYAAIEVIVQTHDSMTTITEVSKNTNEAMQKLIDIVGKVISK